MIRPDPEAFERAMPVLPRVDDEPSRLGRAALWGTIALATFGAHAGLYIILSRNETVTLRPPQPPAAIMINLAPIAVTAKSDVDNNTAGPPTAASEQSEKAEEEPTPPPPEIEPIPEMKAPPAVKAEVFLPPPPPKQEPPPKPVEKKIVEKKEKPKPKPKPKKVQAVAAKAAGGPRSETGAAEATAAAAVGSAVSEFSRASWLGDVRARIVRNKRYPSEARSLGETGLAKVAITIAASGEASSVRLVGSSGSASIDQESVAVIYRSAPFPPPPSGKATVLTVPINFNRR